MLANVTFRNILNAALDLAIPRTCLACGRKLSLREFHLCLFCLADLPRTFFSRLPHNPLADRFNMLIQRELDMTNGTFEPYALATALFFYRPGTGYRKITQALKYHGNLAAGRFFSAQLGREMAASGLFRTVDTVIPVPLHWTRKWSRGHNQAEVIASEIARALHADLRTDILYRPRRTRSQARLPLEQKARNVASAFRINPKLKRPGPFRHILLADDVFTTGATLFACFKALRQAFRGEVRISVAVLAYVGL